MGVGAVVGLVTALAVLSQATSVPVVGFACCLMRFSGPECIMILGNTTVNRWFVRRRGWAAVLRSVSEAGLLAFPAMVGPTIHATGWRHAVQRLSVVILAIGILACTALRTDPEGLGMRPDGDAPPACKGAVAGTTRSARKGPQAVDEPAWEFSEVIREPYFWAMAAASALFSLFWAGLNLHSIDVFTQNGVPREDVASLTVLACTLEVCPRNAYLGDACHLVRGSHF